MMLVDTASGSGKGRSAVDAAVATWHRVLAAIRRIFRSFEGEQSDDHSMWTLTIRVREDPLDGGWVAECVDLPGCFSQGETKEEALYNLSDAIAGIVSLRLDQHFSDTSAASGGEQELKVALAS